MVGRMARSYESPLRREQADRTRLALLEACEALLQEQSLDEVTLPRVAKRAGVTAPTAYRHFPTQDALVTAFVEHVRHRIGMGHAALTSTPPERLPEIPRSNYAAYEKDGALLRAIMQSPSFDRARLATPTDRAAMAMGAWSDQRGAIRDATLRERLAPIYLLLTPAAWRWLRDTWGLDASGAARAASWAIAALRDAVAQDGAGRGEQRSRPERAKRPAAAAGPRTTSPAKRRRKKEAP
jgi:AcrR family transcriptional regulator